MRDKRNTRPTAATVEWARAKTATYGRVAISCNYSTTAGQPRQALRVSDFLNMGEAAAIPMRDLKTILHKDSRTIRRLVELERRNGTLILSNNRTGYYLAETRAEIESFCRSMKSRAFEIERTAGLVKLAAAKAGLPDD